MATTRVSIDRKCPECGGGIVLIYSKQMTHAHCANECGFGMTATNVEVPVERYATPEEAYDAMRAIPMFVPM